MKLEYASRISKAGHSRFGIASLSMAGVVYTFTALVGLFDITPFASMGHQKEIRVAVIAAMVGVLLAIRAIQDAQHKQVLAVLGLVLNGLAIPAALILLPCLD